MTQVGKDFLAEINPSEQILSASEVGEAAAKIISEAKSASVWYIHKTGDQPWEVPDGNTMEALMACRPK